MRIITASSAKNWRKSIYYVISKQQVKKILSLCVCRIIIIIIIKKNKIENIVPEHRLLLNLVTEENIIKTYVFNQTRFGYRKGDQLESDKEP